MEGHELRETDALGRQHGRTTVDSPHRIDEHRASRDGGRFLVLVELGVILLDYKNGGQLAKGGGVLLGDDIGWARSSVTSV